MDAAPVPTVAFVQLSHGRVSRARDSRRWSRGPADPAHPRRGAAHGAAAARARNPRAPARWPRSQARVRIRPHPAVRIERGLRAHDRAVAGRDPRVGAVGAAGPGRGMGGDGAGHEIVHGGGLPRVSLAGAKRGRRCALAPQVRLAQPGDRRHLGRDCRAGARRCRCRRPYLPAGLPGCAARHPHLRVFRNPRLVRGHRSADAGRRSAPGGRGGAVPPGNGRDRRRPARLLRLPGQGAQRHGARHARVPCRKGCADRRKRGRKGHLRRGEAARRGGERGKVALPGDDEPRAAHAPQRHPRLFGGHEGRAARAHPQRQLQGIRRQHPRERPTSAAADRRRSRSGAHRGRPLRASTRNRSGSPALSRIACAC